MHYLGKVQKTSHFDKTIAKMDSFQALSEEKPLTQDIKSTQEALFRNA